MQIDPKDIKTILVVRNDRFGEFLLNIPAFRALKETFVQAKLIALIDPYTRELAGGIPFIDEIIEWGRQGHSLLARFLLVKALKNRHIDMAVILNPSKEWHITSRLADIPVRVGYDRKSGFLLTHKIKDRKYLGEKHEIEYNLELVSLVGAKTQDETLSLAVEEKTIDGLLKYAGIRDRDDLIAVHPWTSDPIKQWPLEYFYRLVQGLTKELDGKVLIIGGKDEADKDPYFQNSQGENLINLAGKTSLGQLAALLKRCRLLISGDSGPVHLACAVNTRVLVIFRNDIPGKSARRWGPWGEGHITIEKDNLKDIRPDEVLAKAKEILRKG